MNTDIFKQLADFGEQVIKYGQEYWQISIMIVLLIIGYIIVKVMGWL